MLFDCISLRDCVTVKCLENTEVLSMIMIAISNEYYKLIVLS